MDTDKFRYWAHAAADWSADYLDSLPERPVRAQTSPGDILKQIDQIPPESGQPMETIFEDFKTIIPDGMTHWQHPRFFCLFSFQCRTCRGHCRATGRRACLSMHALADLTCSHRTRNRHD